MGVQHVAKVFDTASPGRMTALQRPPTRTSMRRVSRGMLTTAVLNHTGKCPACQGPIPFECEVSPLQRFFDRSSLRCASSEPYKLQ